MLKMGLQGTIPAPEMMELLPVEKLSGFNPETQQMNVPSLSPTKKDTQNLGCFFPNDFHPFFFKSMTLRFW